MLNNIEIENLNNQDIEVIKQELLHHISGNWKKVARVIGETMTSLKTQSTQWNGIPDTYYAKLIRQLADDHKIISRGNLHHMRYSEVCLKES